MGLGPCPRCLTPKSLFNFLGLSRDMRSRVNNLREYVVARIVKARNFIYANGNTVDGVKVEHTLGEGSWVPTLVSKILCFIIISSRTLLAESIFPEAWTARLRLIPHARSRLHA